MTVARLIEKPSEIPQDAMVELKMACPGTETATQSKARAVIQARDGTVFVTGIEGGAGLGTPN